MVNAASTIAHEALKWLGAYDEVMMKRRGRAVVAQGSSEGVELRSIVSIRASIADVPHEGLGNR